VVVDDPKLELYLPRTVDQSIRPNVQVQMVKMLAELGDASDTAEHE
jgi:hypothetical protein